MTEKEYIKLLKKADQIVKSHFVYTNEPEDKWKSSFDDVLAAEQRKDMFWVFHDDCDGLAETTIEYAIHLGVPKEMLGRAMVDSTGGNKVDHMTGIFKFEEQLYIFGDTFGSLCKLEQSQHNVCYVNWLNDARNWIEVTVT